MSESASAARTTRRRRPALALLVAGALFVVGAVCIGVAFVAGFSGSNPSNVLHIGALCAPLGFAVAIGYALRSGRRAPRED